MLIIMKRIAKNRFKIISLAIVVIIIITTLTGCTEGYFPKAPQGISEDTRISNAYENEMLRTDALNYKGFIFKDGQDAICFRLKSPENVNESKEYPLVIFLHGSGSWGDNNLSQMYGSFIDALDQYAPEECYVFIPQSTEEADWSDKNYIAKNNGIDSLYNKCLDEIIKNNKIDKNRVYITGMSMGGHGTLWQAAKYPQKYAAAIPVCGVFYDDYGNSILDGTNGLVDMPIWFFHSKNDGVVPFDNSENLSKMLIEQGNAKVKTTWFEEPFHDITALSFGNKEVWSWLFAQNKNN